MKSIIGVCVAVVILLIGGTICTNTSLIDKVKAETLYEYDADDDQFYAVIPKKGGAKGEQEKPVDILDKLAPDGICTEGWANLVVKKTDCNRCHTSRNYEKPEIAVDANYDYPSRNLKFYFEGEKPVKAVIRVDDISSQSMQSSLEYCEKHGVKDVVIEVDSPGGSVFDGWREVGIIQKYMGKGYNIESECLGVAFSCGFLIFLTPDKRSAAPTAEMMWHEAWMQEYGGVTNKSTKEEELKFWEHLQSTANQFVADRSEKVDKKGVDAEIRHKEWWMNGKQAHEMGFVTDLL